MLSQLSLLEIENEILRPYRKMGLSRIWIFNRKYIFIGNYYPSRNTVLNKCIQDTIKKLSQVSREKEKSSTPED